MDNHELFTKVQKIIDIITEEICPTRNYEDLGLKSAVWQDVSELITNAGAAHEMGNIGFEINCSVLDMFADPMLEKVFYYLIDNSLRYGRKKMTTIRITMIERDEDIQIIFKDDSNGISAEDEKQLFTKGLVNIPVLVSSSPGRSSPLPASR